MPVSNRTQQNRSVSGFSLVELLTVIAIIAILAAIIFPVFATVRENARQSTSLSNLHDISTKLGQYQLDHHSYPPVLFGYVYTDASQTYPMDKALAAAQAAGTSVAAAYFPGLYPEYINNINEFTDPNNDVDFSKTWAPDTNFLCTGGAGDDAACGPGSAGSLVKTTSPKGFYAADAYDASLKVSGPNSLEKSTPVTRYQSSWTAITTSGDATGAPLTAWSPPGNKEDVYIRQLRWRNPPPDAFVTCTTYHVPTSNQVLVLYAGGNARKFDYSQFVARGTDVDSIAATGGIAAGNFWQVDPTGH